jgi:hypothetical protein
MVKHYIPQSYVLFDLWFKFLMQYALSKTSGPDPAWTRIPKAAESLRCRLMRGHTPVLRLARLQRH